MNMDRTTKRAILDLLESDPNFSHMDLQSQLELLKHLIEFEAIQIDGDVAIAEIDELISRLRENKVMSKRPRRSEEQLLKIIEHLEYEFFMLNNTAVALATSSLFFGEPINNALVKSFTVHARNLFGFLWDRNPREDDVIASDFFDDQSAWDDNPPTIPQILAPPRPGRQGNSSPKLCSN